MSNALEQASLIMVPSGYEDGTLGSLKPTDGSGDFTFSRGSDISATRVNANGYIEKGYENLLLQSNTFDTTWSVANGGGITGGQAGYDGTNDAWYLYKNTGTSSQLVRQIISSTGVQTFSFYAKAAELEWIRFLWIGGSGGRSHFHLVGDGDTGTLVNTISTSIELVGDGWYKCSTTINENISQIQIYPASGTNSVSGSTGGVYIQDAMLSQGLVAYPYIETTTAPVAGGILEDMPRLDYSNGSCPALLLEPSRTNLAPYSEYIEGLALTDLTATPNATTSPEGLQNAYKMLTGTAGGEQIAYQATGTSGNTKTQSVYIKADSGVQWIRLIQLRAGFANSASTHFDIQNGVKGAKEENGTTSVVDDATKIEDAGNGWYRLTLVCTDSTNNANFDTRVRTAIADGSGTRVSNGSYFVWGYQMESDATYPTSYIPTYGVSQTRLRDKADSLSSPVIAGATEFTWFIDNTGSQLDGQVKVVFQLVCTGTAMRYYSSQGGRFYAGGYFGESNAVGKLCVKYNGTTLTMFKDGLKSTSTIDTNLGTTIYLDRLFTTDSIGAPIRLNQMSYFPTALSDDECIALTTI